jgi:hypothetical protein
MILIPKILWLYFRKKKHSKSATSSAINCKIVAFEVKKSVFFSPYKTGLANFESSWLKTFALHKLEVLYIVLEN